ncbi:hypothetical protein [Streptomyces sp. NPDC086023]|uniref:hypothetical protein n=1 Tax=Streptomyces sp. NPDC086023 TaxID=3365746 RepID=UPI0037CD5632
MIVASAADEDTFYARSEDEVDALVNHIMEDLPQGSATPDGFSIIPEKAVVSIVKGKYPEETDERWESNCLYVSVNTKTGYGALRWYLLEPVEGSGEDHISRFIWTSGSKTPPQ